MMMRRFLGICGIGVLAIASGVCAGELSLGGYGSSPVSPTVAFDADQQLMALLAELELATPAVGNASSGGATDPMNFSLPAVPGWTGGWMAAMTFDSQPGDADRGSISHVGGFSIEGDADMAASSEPPAGNEFGDPLPDLQFAPPDVSPNPSFNNLTATVPLPTSVYMAALGLLLIPVARRFWLGRVA